MANEMNEQAELLQTLHSAVNTSRMIERVAVINTENGPVTLIFMDESTGLLSTSASGPLPDMLSHSNVEVSIISNENSKPTTQMVGIRHSEVETIENHSNSLQQNKVMNDQVLDNTDRCHTKENSLNTVQDLEGEDIKCSTELKQYTLSQTNLPSILKSSSVVIQTQTENSLPKPTQEIKMPHSTSVVVSNGEKDEKHSEIMTEYILPGYEAIDKDSQSFQEPVKLLDRKISKHTDSSTKQHEPPKRYKCTLCLKSFETVNLLLKHRASGHRLKETDQDQNYLDSGKSVKKYKEQYLRQKKNSGRFLAGKPDFNCKPCRRLFLNKTALISHKLWIHKKVKPQIKQSFSVGFQVLFLNKLSRNKRQKLSFDRNKFWNVNHFVKESAVVKKGSLDAFINTDKELGLLDVKKRIFKCLYCHQCFEDGQEVRKHVLVHKTVCSDCGKKHLDQARLRRHKLNVHGTLKDANFDCPNCKRKFGNRPDLLNHMVIHVGPWICERQSCGADFSERKELLAHRKTHITSSLKPTLPMPNVQVKQTDVGLTLGTIDNFIDRKGTFTQTAVGKVHAPVRCKVCREQFANATITRKHIKMVHLKEGSKKFHCSHCEFTSHFGYHLKQHEKKHNRPYHCEVCQLSFDTEAKLRRHLGNHEKDKYQCYYCSKQYLQKSSCIEHIKKFHLQESPSKREDKASVTTSSVTSPYQSRETYGNTQSKTSCAKKGLVSDSDKMAIETENTQDKVAAESMKSNNTKTVDISSSNDHDALAYEIQGMSEKVSPLLETNQDLLPDTEEKETENICEKLDNGDEIDEDNVVEEPAQTENNCQNPSDIRTDSLTGKMEDLSPIREDYGCSQCGETFQKETEFYQHVIHSYTEESFCKICQTNLGTKLRLGGHMFEKHSTGKPLRCPVCSETFWREKSYWNHVGRHTKGYPCQICNKLSFASKQELDRHLETHTSKKKFDCEICGEVLMDRKALTSHMLHSHDIKSKQVHKPKQEKKATDLNKPNEPVDEDQAEEKIWNGNEPTSMLSQSTEDSPVSGKRFHITPQTIEVPNSDVTLELLSDGSIITKDKIGTNFSLINLESLGIDLNSLQGKTNIELVIAQSDGTEVKATIEAQVEKLVDPQSQQTELQPSVETELNNGAQKTRIYKCSKCPRTFKFHKTYLCHIAIHNRNVNFTCHLCKRVFAKAKNLSTHLKLHKTKQDKKKNVCPQTTGKKSKPQEWKCSVCEKVFAAKRQLERHNRDVHELKSCIPCLYCEKIFSTEVAAQRHLKVHVGPFICELCSEEYHSHAELSHHLKKEHDAYKPYTCPICNEPYNNKANYSSHLKKVHRDSEKGRELIEKLKIYVCDECGMKFEKVSHRSTHIQIHKGEKKEVCPFCNARYNQKWKLNDHLRKQHLEKLEHQCPICNDYFLSHDDLMSHEKRKHNKAPASDAELVCDLCSFITNNKSEYREHYLTKHFKGDKEAMLNEYPNLEPDNFTGPVMCDHCGDEFPQIDDLNKHLKSLGLETLSYFLDKEHTSALDKKLKKKSNLDTHMALHDENYLGTSNVDLVELTSKPKRGRKPKNIAVKSTKFAFTSKKMGLNTKSKVSKKRSLCKTTKIKKEEDMESFLGANFSLGKTSSSSMGSLESKLYKCSICGERFNRESTLKQHVTSHIEDSDIEEKIIKNNNIQPLVFKCQQCGNRYATTMGLVSHVRHKHPDMDISSMEIDKPHHSTDEETTNIFATYKRSTGAKKKRLHKGFKTSLKERFTKRDFIKSDRNGEYPCKKCPAVYKTYTGILQHTRTRHPERSSKHSSQFSPTKISKSGRVIKKSAKTLDQIQCEVCFKQFSKEAALLKHLLKWHQGHSPVYKTDETVDKKEDIGETGSLCKFCNKIFKNLGSHLYQKHTDYYIENKHNLGLKKVTKSFKVQKVELSQQDDLRKDDLGLSGDTDRRKRKSFTKMARTVHESSKGSTSVKAEVNDSDEDIDLLLFKCKQCSESFHTRKSLGEHVDTKHSDLFSCRICGKCFKNERAVGAHERFLHGRRLQCTKCLKSFKWKSNLIDHMNEFHKQSGMLVCGVCNKVFPDKKSIKAHLEDHKKMPSRYEDCNKVSPDYSELEYDAEQTHGKKTNFLMSCDICKKSFSSKKLLLGHMLNHTSLKSVKKNDNPSIKTEALVNASSSVKKPKVVEVETKKSNIKKIKSAPSSVKKTKPLETKAKKSGVENNKSFENKAKVVAKGRIAVGLFKKPGTARKSMKDLGRQKKVAITVIKCLYCSKTFQNKHAKQVHLINIHKKVTGAVKDKYCKKCNILFSTQIKLLQHNRNVHKPGRKSKPQTISDKKLKPYRCGQCGDGLQTPKGLKIHQKRVHGGSGEKLNLGTRRQCLMCLECQQLYKSEAEYKAHLKDLHSVAKSPEFPTIETVNDELLETETSDRLEIKQEVDDELVVQDNIQNIQEQISGPFSSIEHQCSICKEIFITSIDLGEHMTSQHGNNTIDDNADLPETTEPLKQNSQNMVNTIDQLLGEQSTDVFPVSCVVVDVDLSLFDSRKLFAVPVIRLNKMEISEDGKYEYEEIDETEDVDSNAVEEKVQVGDPEKANDDIDKEAIDMDERTDDSKDAENSNSRGNAEKMIKLGTEESHTDSMESTATSGEPNSKGQLVTDRDKEITATVTTVTNETLNENSDLKETTDLNSEKYVQDRMMSNTEVDSGETLKSLAIDGESLNMDMEVSLGENMEVDNDIAEIDMEAPVVSEFSNNTNMDCKIAPNIDTGKQDVSEYVEKVDNIPSGILIEDTFAITRDMKFPIVNENNDVNFDTTDERNGNVNSEVLTEESVNTIEGENSPQ